MRFFLFFILFSFSFWCYSQEKDVEIVVAVENDDSGKKLSGATVSVYANGKLVTSSTSSGNGKVPTIYVPTGEYYQIFIRKSGFVTKMAELDARIDIIEDAPDPLYLKFETALFESIEGVDFSFLETTPMTKFDFDSEYYYRFDKEYTTKMLKKIEELKRQIAEKREEEEKKEKEDKKTEADFRAYVQAGDKATGDGKYETAVQQYGLALELRKDNAEVAGKLKEAQRLLEEQKKKEALEKQYLEKMAQAAKAYGSEALQEALNLYTEASALKPSEKEPKEKIDEIRLKIAEQKAQEEKFKALVKQGDLAIASEGFDEGIAKYTEALGIKDDAEVKEKLEAAKKRKSDLEAEAAAKKQIDEQYSALISNAEDLLSKDKLEESKGKFQEALTLKPEEILPKKKIEEIDKLISEKEKQEKLEADYKAKMMAAKSAFNQKEWDKALAAYQEASDLKPLEPEPKEKIREINDLLEKQKAQQAEYERYIQEGDQFASTEAYEEAVSKYEKARVINETDEVTKKIKDALDAMQALSEARNKALKLEAEYAALIEKADKQRDEDELDKAIETYEEALKLKEDEAYPKGEIAKINKLKEERKAEAEAKAKADAEYQAIIEEADKQFDDGNWNEAKTKYTEATTLRADDAHPKARLKEIEDKLKELADLEALNKQYDEAMAAGKSAVEKEEYNAAIEAYQKAKEIKPDESEPKEKIDEINKILADLKNEAEKEAAYEAAMKSGDELRDAQTYEKAKESYQNALTYKPGDSRAQEEIGKIDKILADLADEAQKQLQFSELVAAGDEAFGSADYETAKKKYTEAIGIKPDEAIDEKIKSCDAKLNEISEQNAQKAKFEELLKAADDLFKEEKWNEAIAKYEAAKAIESNDYISDQIKAANSQLELAEKDKEVAAKVEKLIADAKEFEAAKSYEKALNSYKEAYALKPEPSLETLIKSVEKEILNQEEMANQKLAYDEKIKEADAAYDREDFISAIDLYQSAKSMKADEAYPDQQIKLCNDELAKLSAKENTEKYNGVISQADRYFSEKKYDDAITQYELAKQILPEKTYPQEKINEIKSIRDQIANAEAEKLKKENDYKNLVASADEKYDSQNFETALSKYKEAQKIKPFDNYVTDKIKKTEDKLAALNAAKATAQKYQSYIDKADGLMKDEKWKSAIAEYKNALLYDKENPYPKKQIELAEKAMENDSKELSESAYQDLLKEAQAKMDAKAYEESLTLFKSAYRQRPEDNIPADKIRELNALIANKNAAESAKDKYQSLISKADNLFEKKEWKKARIYYVEAYNLTNESYPDNQIKKIDAINNKFSSDQYTKMIKKADEYFYAENYEKAKGLYNRAIKTFTSQNSTYPKAQIQKINAILNPPSVLAGGTAKPVGEKVNLSEAEIQKMFEEAEAASKNKEQTKVLNAGQSAENIVREWQSEEVNASYVAIDSIKLQKELVKNEIASAEKNRQAVEKGLSDVENKVKESSNYEREYGENVSFRQMQVVDNIGSSITHNRSNNDKSREEFEPVVVNMEDQYQVDQFSREVSQNNILHTQINQIKTIKEEQDNAFVNADVARANTELDVSNAEINITNRANKELWQQEDQVFSTVVAKENMEAEQYESIEYSDVPRQNMEKLISDSNDEFKSEIRASHNQHNTITGNTNDAVVDLADNIVMATKNADDARQHMELVDAEYAANIKNASINQAALNQEQVEMTDESLTMMKKDQNKYHQNKTDKLYQDTETIESNFNDIKNESFSNLKASENSMYEAVSAVEYASNTISKNSTNASHSAENSIDEIMVNQDLMSDEQYNIEQNNEKIRNVTEDKIISLRDIDVKAVTQSVKNELGNQYPEGVTEEVYQQKDEDGYLISYVIRRVVVKDGEGNVYEKSQMKHGISYSKNGQAITKYTWQEQTEDASLTYH